MVVVPQWPPYLYLTTTGRISGQRHEIEIWSPSTADTSTLLPNASANWVRNIQLQPRVKVRIGDSECNAIGRVVYDDREPQLAATVKALFDAKYGWSNGLIFELTACRREHRGSGASYGDRL
jgi:hypothetical protein